MALSRHHAALSRPRNVEEIVNEAKSFEFNSNRSLQQWIRSGKMLLTEAAICEQDGNIQMAYLYTYRHAELIIAKLPEHPEYGDPRFKNDVTQAKKAVRKNLLKLEQWNPRINQDYQRYAKAMERRREERQRIREQNDSAQSRWHSVDSFDLQPGRDLDVQQDRQAAVGQALKELQRRGMGKQVNMQSNATTDDRPRPPMYHQDSIGDSEKQVSENIRKAGQHLYQYPSKASHGAPTSRYESPSYAYPAVPSKEHIMNWRSFLPPVYSEKSLPPAIPSKTPLHDMIIPELPITAPPPIPLKEAFSNSPPPLPSKTSIPIEEPPSFHHPKPSTSLRSLILPNSLTPTFTSLASSNTTQNLETCGILAGTLLSNSSTLALTHLILPAQTSTPNTCDTTPEGDAALFDYCDTHNLLVLGWIHTHPSQTCFLSSRDLHTSAGYQTMLPEAIAVVCAPRYEPSVGIFRLTDPPGLETILKCTALGTFHPHPDVEGGLYTDADGDHDGRRGEGGGGHVVVAEELGLKVVDLRG